MTAQMALILGWPLPSYLLWAVIAAAGAATVLSFAILAEYFPKEISGRANAALNILHVGGAFVLQVATGLIIALWPQAGGTYPAEAHQTAMAAILGLQVAAFAWFALPIHHARVSPIESLARSLLTSGRTHASAAAGPHTFALPVWREHARIAQRHAVGWRLAAAASALLSLGLATALSTAIAGPSVAVHIVQVDHSVRVAIQPDDPAMPGSIAVLERDRHARLAPSLSSPPLVMEWALRPTIPSTANPWTATVIRPTNPISKRSSR
jgi:hypothetical protein